MKHVQRDRLAKLVKVFRRWMHLPNADLVYVVLGTIAANLIPGCPVWLMLVGPSSGGKTEILLALIDVAKVFMVATLTEAALLSGTANRERAKDATGGLLRQIGEFGFIVCKDFTSVLSMHRDERSKVMAALREIYDGSWNRPLGVDGGRSLSWEGKVGLIAGCTPIYDKHHAVIAAMGERFVVYRLPKIDDMKQAEAALSHAGEDDAMHTELRQAVATFFEGLRIPPKLPPITADEKQRLLALATLAVRCRSAVDRDSYTRTVENLLPSELPARIVRVLAQLFGGLKVIGVEDSLAWRIIVRVALDSMPAIRRRVFNILAKQRRPISVAAVAQKLRCPRITATRTLEDLQLHGITRRKKGEAGKEDQWRLSRWARERYQTATATSSETSGTHGKAKGFRNVR